MRRKSLIVVIDKKTEKSNSDKNSANAEQNAADLLNTSAENTTESKSDKNVIKPIVGTSARSGRSSSGSRRDSNSRSGSNSQSVLDSRTESRSDSRSNSSSRNRPIVGLGYRSGKSRSESSSQLKSSSRSKSSSRYKTGSQSSNENKPIVGTKLQSSKSGTRASGKARSNVFYKIATKLGLRSRRRVSSAWILASTLLIVVLTVQLAFIADTLNRYRSSFSEYDAISAEIKALNDPLTVKKDEYIENYINNLLNKTLSATELAAIARKYWKYEIKINGIKVTDSFLQYVPNGLKIELFQREKERVFPAKIHLSGALSGGKADDVLSSHISFVPDDGFTIKNENYNETDAVTGEKYKVTKVTYTFTSTSVRNEDRVEIKVDPELAQRIT